MMFFLDLDRDTSTTSQFATPSSVVDWHWHRPLITPDSAGLLLLQSSILGNNLSAVADSLLASSVHKFVFREQPSTWILMWKRRSFSQPYACPHLIQIFKKKKRFLFLLSASNLPFHDHPRHKDALVHLHHIADIHNLQNAGLDHHHHDAVLHFVMLIVVEPLNVNVN